MNQNRAVADDFDCRSLGCLGLEARNLFFDPHDRLDPVQYTHGKVVEISAGDWEIWKKRIVESFSMSGVEIIQDDVNAHFVADGQEFTIEPKYFKLITPKGGLRGYESH